MQAPTSLDRKPRGVQVNLARILSTTALQWGLPCAPVARVQLRRPVRGPRPSLRAAAQTALGLTWGWCY